MEKEFLHQKLCESNNKKWYTTSGYGDAKHAIIEIRHGSTLTDPMMD